MIDYPAQGKPYNNLPAVPEEMFEVGFELVSATMPNVMVLPTELPG